MMRADNRADLPYKGPLVSAVASAGVTCVCVCGGGIAETALAVFRLKSKETNTLKPLK